jgi:hypothetical protein
MSLAYNVSTPSTPAANMTVTHSKTYSTSSGLISQEAYVYQNSTFYNSTWTNYDYTTTPYTATSDYTYNLTTNTTANSITTVTNTGYSSSAATTGSITYTISTSTNGTSVTEVDTSSASVNIGMMTTVFGTNTLTQTFYTLNSDGSQNSSATTTYTYNIYSLGTSSIN